MAEKNKLSIYLVKDEFSASDQTILKNGAVMLADLENVGKVYYLPSQTHEPAWVNTFFRGNLGNARIFTSNARAVLICRVNVAEGVTKAFAITMGYGKNMLADDVIEEDFGLKVVLNTISHESLRRINKVNIGGNQKSSNEQLPLASNIDGFGFDIDRDLISTITGYSDDEDFASGIMTGSDLLSLTAEVDVTNLGSFLQKAHSRYISTQYRQSFGWIDHIRRVKSAAIIERLDAEVIRLISENSPKVWMAVPEVIEWEKISGFKYAGREVYDDIDIQRVCSGLKTPLTHIDQLKGKHIRVIRADNDETYVRWTAYKCLYAEADYNGSAYCLNNGRWFCVDRDFVSTVNAEYENIPVSDRTFLPHQPEYKRESQYTQAFVQSDPQHLLCMDAKVISHGGGQSRVELCDILTDDHTYIHIKPYSGSSTLSHLFNQAVVSAELVMSDREFLIKANTKIREEGGDDRFFIAANHRPDVILAIISPHNDDRPPIPFFSKIALRYATRRLQAYGCNVAIKNIPKASE